MISYEKIMISCAESHNFNAGCHNISTECHNFFERGVFSSTKILNEKVELWTFNVCWKAMVKWSKMKWCAPHQIFCTVGSAQIIFLSTKLVL